MTTAKYRESIGSGIVRDIKDSVSGNAFSGKEALEKEKMRRIIEQRSQLQDAKDSLETGKGSFRTPKSKHGVI